MLDLIKFQKKLKGLHSKNFTSDFTNNFFYNLFFYLDLIKIKEKQKK